MASHRMNFAIASLVALGSIGLLSRPASSGEPLDHAGIEKRIQQIQPTAKERRFEEIGWVDGLREAERIAKLNHRPVFLFSNVGQMDLGRC